MSIVPVPFEIASLAVLVLVLVGDIVLAYRNKEAPSTRQCAIWVGVYAALALGFAGLLVPVAGPDHAVEFLAGWLTEYSLSIDNLFVFLVIMAGFAVPRRNQQEVLMWGIILALVFRAVFILVGAQLIASFSWIFYLFGAFLIYTAARQAFGSEHGDAQSSGLVRFAKRHLAVTDDYDGHRWRTTVGGRRMWTPVVLVLVALGSTDVLFALDSIPAIFGITQSPFIVFTTNVFALMGLRQLYFLLGDLVERLVYLKYGIAFILAFIGVKLVLHALHENSLPFLNGGEHLDGVPDIGTGVSLAVIVLSMAVATVASLVAMRRRTVEPVSRQERLERAAPGHHGHHGD
ncbi:TerC family protein [Amnibacterium sp. CER49]|uniref:TerC family protein n=1 Tax=Amnibacterium sp. CER49 TaxID=3039161 RepID=UPI00244BE689|nr:TerC family protein [Amnibacterium sp. CER49]MDH2442802.1 TerC family protein [Amnibacterium sp. CER49]